MPQNQFANQSGGNKRLTIKVCGDCLNLGVPTKSPQDVTRQYFLKHCLQYASETCFPFECQHRHKNRPFHSALETIAA